MTQKTSVPKTLIPGCTKLASLSVAVAMALGLLISIPKQVGGQTQPTPSAQQSAELVEAERLNQQVLQLYKEGKYAQAIPLAERALAIREKVLGKEHLEVASSLSNLAILYKQQWRYEKAEPLLKRSLAIDEKILGKEHRYTAISLNNLAQLYHDMGNYEKAEPLYKKSLAIFEKVLGLQHPEVAKYLSHLAILYRKQGSYQKAESLYKRSLAIMQKAYGKYHPSVAIMLDNLAVMYSEQGSYEKGEQLSKRSLAIFEKVYGKYHPDVAINLMNLAALYQSQGSYEKAQLLYKRSLAIFEKVYGKYHPTIATNLDNLATLYRLQGSYEKAEQLSKRSLTIFEKVYGEYHPSVANNLMNLSALYWAQGSYEKAEQLSKRSLAIFEKRLGAYHPKIATNLNNLAMLYWIKDDITRATDLLSRALEIQERNLKFIFTGISEQRKQNYMDAFTFTSTVNNIVSLSLNEARNNPKAAQLALTTVLRRKGRVLDAVTDSTQILRSQLKNNPEAQQLFDEWLNVQQQLSALLYKGIGKQTPAQYKARYQKLEAKREELEAAISAKSAEFRTEIEPVELAAVQTKIPKDAALIEIVQYQPFNSKATNQDEMFGKPRYAAAILRNQGQPKWVDLGEAATINQSVSELRRALSSAPPDPNRGIDVEPADGKSVKELARNLDEQVMKPLRSHLGNARHLLLSPDGQLTLIPFEALRDDKGKYLVENYAFSYLTSGRDLLRFDATANNNSAPVVFADIDYDEQQTKVAASTRGSENRRSTDLASMKYKPLSATLEEAQKIKSIFSNTKIISKKQATETALKQLQSPSILHLATHGFFLPDPEVDLLTPDVGLITNKIVKCGCILSLIFPFLPSRFIKPFPLGNYWKIKKIFPPISQSPNFPIPNPEFKAQS